jgi:hypothetical protein
MNLNHKEHKILKFVSKVFEASNDPGNLRPKFSESVSHTNPVLFLFFRPSFLPFALLCVLCG